MTERILIVTGGDSNFFDLVRDTVLSLESQRILKKYPLAIFDFGLSEEQIQYFSQYTETIVKPNWDLPVKENERDGRALGKISRPFIKDYFPDYDYYLWIDGDAWVQDDAFIKEYLDGAKISGLAIVKEKEPAYRFQGWLFAWSIMTYIRMFGLVRGLYLRFFCKPINNGVFMIANNAPHWEIWKKWYKKSIARSGKLHNQPPLHAAINFGNLPVSYMKGYGNWVTSRGTPKWNPITKKFCLPYKGNRPISVVHLAGPEKNSEVLVKFTDGSSGKMLLRFPKVEFRT